MFGDLILYELNALQFSLELYEIVVDNVCKKNDCKMEKKIVYNKLAV